MTSNPPKSCVWKIYVHEIAAADLSKIYFLKNAKKTCKPNNRDLNRDWKILESESKKAISWFQSNKMIVNPGKFQGIIIDKKKQNHTPEYISIDQKNIKT